MRSHNFGLRFMLTCIPLFLSMGCQDDVVISQDRAWVILDDMAGLDMKEELDGSRIQDASQKDMSPEPVVDMPIMDMESMCPTREVDACVTQTQALWDQGCDDDLGVFFDGKACRPAQGCACEGDGCPTFFDSVESCARTCGQEGQCAQDVMPWGKYSADMYIPVTCQEGIAVCYDSEQDPTAVINQRFAKRIGFECSPPEASSICEFRLELGCSQQWCCYGPPEDGVEERAELQELCGGSLYPEVLGITCINLE
jgi:hypothetical protein